MKSQYRSSLRIKALTTYACAALLISSLQSNAYSAVIFSSGWEQAPGTGCTAPTHTVDQHLTDNFRWDDHGFDPCNNTQGSWTGHAMSVVTDEKRSGNKSLRFSAPDVSYLPNGPGGGVVKNFSPALSDWYFSAYVKWSPNFRWQTDTDYKWVITDDSSGTRIYVQWRGHANTATAYPYVGNHHEGDHPYYDRAFSIQTNRWYHVEFHIKTSTTNGIIEMRIDEQPVNLRDPNGKAPVNINTGGPRRKAWVDNTINSYINNWFPNNVAGNAYWWVDDVSINNGDGWTSSSTIQPPANLRIIP